MVESHPQPASVDSESEVKTGPATQSITILGLGSTFRGPTPPVTFCNPDGAVRANYGASGGQGNPSPSTRFDSDREDVPARF